MSVAAITDYTFDTLDIEKAILEPLGCQIISQKVYKSMEGLIALVEHADYVITQYAPIDARIIRGMHKCRVIVRYGIGVDNIDLVAAAERKIAVCNIPDFCVDEVADHTIAMILEMTRRVSENASVVRGGSWGLAVPLESMRVLSDMTVGIVAFGRIGRQVALRLKPFKCKILVADPVVPSGAITNEGCVPVELGELIEQSDLITLHCPSTAGTLHIINAQSISRMKRGALLVNVSRGDLVKTEDLVYALQSGKISAAALDVTDPEPIDRESPLRKMANVIITSHIAYSSPKAYLKVRKDAAEIIAKAILGEELMTVVNGIKLETNE